MAKYKWIQLDSDNLPARMIKALLIRQFNIESGRGFRISSKTENFISGNFVERSILREKIVDPFGEVSEIEVTRYASTKFRLYFNSPKKGSHLLEIGDPPRSIRSLILEFSEIFNGVTVVELNLPLMDIYLTLRRNSPRARIVKLKASGISISQNSELRVEVNSSEDAYRDFKEYFAKSNGRVEKIKVEQPLPGTFSTIEISANGLCNLEENSEDLIRELILNLHQTSKTTGKSP